MKLRFKVLVVAALAIGAVAAATKWRRQAEHPSAVPAPSASMQPIGPAPAIATVPGVPKPVVETTAQAPQERPPAVAKPAVQKKSKKRKGRSR